MISELNQVQNLKSISISGSWQNLFLSLFDLSKDIIFILDQNGYLNAINNAGSIALDFSQNELEGKHLSELINQNYLQSFNDAFAQALKTNHAEFETSFLNKFDRQNIFQVLITTIREKEKISGLIGICKEITKTIEIEDELKSLKPKLIEIERLLLLERSRASHNKVMLDELNRLKNEFVSNISHELRTPLASIVGFSETIASDPNMPVEMRTEFNLIILNESKRLAKLINEVLDLSRMETGRIVLNKTKTDIVKVIYNAIADFDEPIKEKSIHLSIEIPDEELIIDADEERLLQAICAILDNSVKFSNKGSRIKVILRNLFREVEIIISDTGIGIPEKDLPFVFQKFYRVNRPDTEFSGAGMGLVFVKQIVDLHKGLINIQSEPGKGTTIVIKLLKNYRD